MEAWDTTDGLGGTRIMEMWAPAREAWRRGLPDGGRAGSTYRLKYGRHALAHVSP